MNTNIAQMPEVTDARMAGIVITALQQAGREMDQTDPNGDHGPLIKATIHSIAKDLEESSNQNEVDEVMKTHLYEQLEIMESELRNCERDVKTELAPKFRELREAYDAYFSPLDASVTSITEDEFPAYAKRTKAILGEQDVFKSDAAGLLFSGIKRVGAIQPSLADKLAARQIMFGTLTATTNAVLMNGLHTTHKMNTAASVSRSVREAAIAAREKTIDFRNEVDMQEKPISPRDRQANSKSHGSLARKASGEVPPPKPTLG